MEIREFFQLHKTVAVALSGGVDSAVLLLLAKQYAERVKAYYVSTPFQPRFEYEDARSVAALTGAELQTLSIDVLTEPLIVSNPDDRCYYCKKRLFTAICNAARRDGLEAVLDGTNASDDIRDRAGFRALRELGVQSPLRECGYTKEQIRALARAHRLPVADKPSYACLATRISTGTVITKPLLETTETAEGLLREMGFRNFRVRYADGAARLELGSREMELLHGNRSRVRALLSPYYKDICVDLRERPDE